jgi:hypothetical protein
LALQFEEAARRHKKFSSGNIAKSLQFPFIPCPFVIGRSIPDVLRTIREEGVAYLMRD